MFASDLSPHALQGFTGVIAVDLSLDRNMIHQCTYTTVHTHNHWLTGCGVDVIMVANRKPC